MLKDRQYLPSQRTLLEHLAKLQGIAQKVSEEAVKTKCVDMADSVRACELVIPVVGGFSAGKSTMLNTLLGEQILPTAIKPETSLAMELRYSENPRIEAVLESGNSQTLPLADIKTLSDNAEKYNYAKVYLNNQRLNEILPLVLVDMPGFESPRESHNKAILSYLGRGCHYLVLCDITEGTLSQTVLRRLLEIESYGRNFNIFLSKTDLKAKEDVEKIAAHARDILDDEFGSGIAMGLINSKSVAAVNEAVQALDPDALMRAMWFPALLTICNDLLNNINLRIKGTEKNKNDIEAIIAEMEDGIAQIKIKSKAEADNIRASIAGAGVNDIIRSVGSALSESREELVGIIVNGHQSTAEDRLNEILRMTLVSAFKEKLSDINIQICNEFSASLQGIDRAMREHCFDDAYINQLSGKIKTAFENLGWLEKNGGTISKVGTLLANPALNLGSRAAGGIMATGLLGAVSGALMPILGTVVLFLPEILGFFFKDANKEKAREIVRQKLEGEVFPGIKNRLRGLLPEELQKQANQMISSAQSQYEQMLNEKKAALEKVKNSHDSEIKEKKAEASLLAEARNEVQTIMETIYTKNPGVAR